VAGSRASVQAQQQASATRIVHYLHHMNELNKYHFAIHDVSTHNEGHQGAESRASDQTHQQALATEMPKHQHHE